MLFLAAMEAVEERLLVPCLVAMVVVEVPLTELSLAVEGEVVELNCSNLVEAVVVVVH